jgi:hypothetical protein
MDRFGVAVQSARRQLVIKILLLLVTWLVVISTSRASDRLLPGELGWIPDMPCWQARRLIGRVWAMGIQKGMTQEQVKKILGSDYVSQHCIVWKGRRSTRWHYSNLGVGISFESDEESVDRVTEIHPLSVNQIDRPCFAIQFLWTETEDPFYYLGVYEPTAVWNTIEPGSPTLQFVFP